MQPPRRSCSPCAACLCSPALPARLRACPFPPLQGFNVELEPNQHGDIPWKNMWAALSSGGLKLVDAEAHQPWLEEAHKLTHQQRFTVSEPWRGRSSWLEEG